MQQVIRDTAITGRPTQIAIAPFVSVIRDEIDSEQAEPTYFDVGLWRSDKNVCECQAEDTPCETAAGIFYGTSSSLEPMFCPRHFYELHLGPKAPSTLMLTDELSPLLARKLNR